MVEDLGNKGADTLLYNALSHDLGYDVRWITPDTVAVRNSAYFDTAFSVVVWCGLEVAYPEPSAVADTIANSRVGFVSLASNTWDEINLGVNSNGTNGRVLENTGMVIVINNDHWVTRVLQDTLFLWAATAVQIYGLAFPDTAHDITPLVVDKDFVSDTANVLLCVADSGGRIINTGDGRNIAKGRRGFLGLFSVQSTPRDSCQFFTIFNRLVAWAARDTLNQHLTHTACFTGRKEVEDAWAERSGSDTTKSYGGWQTLYTGYDWGHKVAFMKINNSALRRKVPYSSPQVDQFVVRTRVSGVLNSADDSLWESINGIKLIKQKWIAGNATGQSNTNFVNWVFRYIELPDTFRWYAAGAFGANVDVVDTVLDSAWQNRDNTYQNAAFHWSIPPQFAVRLLRDTTQNHGWVWHNLWNNQVGELNDAEIVYHSSEANGVLNRPLITVRLASLQPLASTRRRMPVVGHGLLGGFHQ